MTAPATGEFLQGFADALGVPLEEATGFWRDYAKTKTAAERTALESGTYQDGATEGLKFLDWTEE